MGILRRVGTDFALSQNTGATLTLTYPTDAPNNPIQIGDIALIAVANFESRSWAIPTGFENTAESTLGVGRVSFFTKIIDGSEGATVVITPSASCASTGMLWIRRALTPYTNLVEALTFFGVVEVASNTAIASNQITGVLTTSRQESVAAAGPLNAATSALSSSGTWVESLDSCGTSATGAAMEMGRDTVDFGTVPVVTHTFSASAARLVAFSYSLAERYARSAIAGSTVVVGRSASQSAVASTTALSAQSASLASIAGAAVLGARAIAQAIVASSLVLSARAIAKAVITSAMALVWRPVRSVTEIACQLVAHWGGVAGFAIVSTLTAIFTKPDRRYEVLRNASVAASDEELRDVPIVRYETLRHESSDPSGNTFENLRSVQ